jgi:putative hydrolase of the HAD superfamily
MQLPKAILFDLDDTVISFDGISEKSWEKACISFVEENHTVFDAPALLRKINFVRKWYWSDPQRHQTGRADLNAARRQIVKISLSALDFSNESHADKMADNYSKMHEASLCLLNMAYKALENIRGLGIRMAVITNGTSEKQRGKLNRFNILHFFEFVLIDEEVGFSKPDIRIFELALAKLSLDPGEVWMIGDDLYWDVEPSQTLGIYSVWNDYGQKGLPVDSIIFPDKTVGSIYDLSLELMQKKYFRK